MRRPTIPEAMIPEVKNMHDSGLGATRIAHRLMKRGIRCSRWSVLRVINAQGAYTAADGGEGDD